MPSPWAIRLGAFVLGLMVALSCDLPAAAATRSPAPLVLKDASGALPGDAVADAWLDTTGTATIQEVAQSSARFAPASTDKVYALGSGRALWLRLRLVRAQGQRQQWLLVTPNPLIDDATVWQRDHSGRWTAQIAGDVIPVQSWPQPGRYPAFRLDLPEGQECDVYLQVRNVIPASVPLALVSDAVHHEQLQIEYLGLGIAYGALLLLIAAALAQSWVHRDEAYVWYAAYITLATLSVMAYTGVAAHLLWPWSAWLADSATGVLVSLATGAALLFVRGLTGTVVRHARIARLTQTVAWAGPVLAVAFVLMERRVALELLSAYMLVAAVLNLTTGWLSWRRGDTVGLWVLAAHTPLALAILAAVARLMGLVPISFATQYAVLLALVAEVPLLLVALSLRSRDRHGAQIRAQALSSHDALTGLLGEHIFRDRLQQVTRRYKLHREDAAVVFIDLVNHARIKAAHGPAVAEQSLLRSVIKLRRVLRDVDTVGRIGEARFGLILEGVTSRTSVTDRAARLIASGLMPLQGLKPDVPLQFHVAAVLLRERMAEPADLEALLAGLLASMSGRTRRPIRFLKPEDTEPVPLDADGDSELPDDAVAAR